jgi:hypothetical protein
MERPVIIQGPSPRPGDIVVDQGCKTVVRIKELKGYRPGQIHVVLDDEGKERMIRFADKAWVTI